MFIGEASTGLLFAAIAKTLFVYSILATKPVFLFAVALAASLSASSAHKGFAQYQIPAELPVSGAMATSLNLGPNSLIGQKPVRPTAVSFKKSDRIRFIIRSMLQRFMKLSIHSQNRIPAA